MRIVLFFACLGLMNLHCLGQEYAGTNYSKIFSDADSINLKAGNLFIDSNTIRQAHLLDTSHPAAFFQRAAQLLNASKYNEAAFFYYVGYLRFRYYNSANNRYQPSGDGALLAALKQEIGEPLHLYLHSNIDNYIAILEAALSYYNDNDFIFFPRTNNITRFYAQSKGLEDLIEELRNNKAKYIADWKAERAETEKLISLTAAFKKGRNKKPIKKKGNGKTTSKSVAH